MTMYRSNSNFNKPSKIGNYSALIIFWLLAFWLTLTAAHADNLNNPSKYKPSEDNASTKHLPPTVLLGMPQEYAQSVKPYIQLWQHGDLEPKAQQWLSTDAQDWRIAEQSQNFPPSKYFKLSLLNTTNRSLNYVLQVEGSASGSTKTVILSRSILTQINSLSLSDDANQNLKTIAQDGQKITLKSKETIVLAISSSKHIKQAPVAFIQPYQSFLTSHDSSGHILLFISGGLLALAFLSAISIVVTKSYISALGFIFTFSSIFSLGFISQLHTYTAFPYDFSSTLTLMLRVLSLVVFVALTNEALVYHHQAKPIPKAYLYSSFIFLGMASLIFPSSFSAFGLNTLNLCVSFGCLLFSLLAYFKRPANPIALYITSIKSILSTLSVYLLLQFHNSQITFNHFLLFSAVINALEIISILSLLLHLITASQKVASETMRETIKQEQRVATLSPLIHASRHDLREPLSDIIGLAELIADRPVDQQQRKDIYKIQSVARSGLEKINDIFSYQKTSKQLSTHINTSPFLLTDLLSDCTNFYGQHVNASNQELIIDLAEQTPSHFVGEHEVLRQIIIHSIEYLTVYSNSNEAYIKIDFNSCDQLQISFNYVKTSSNSQENLPSSLQLIKSLTKDMLGNFELNPSCNQIFLTLPFTTFDIDNEHPDSHLLSTGKHVLVIDDNPTSCSVIAAYLKRWGINVHVAHNLSEAQAKARHQQKLANHIDLAIVDFLLTGSTGLELVKQLIDDTNISKPIPVIIMSNAPYLVDIKEANSFGIKHILEKPILADTLKIAVIEEFQQQILSSEKLNSASKKIDGNTNKQRLLLVEDSLISAKILTTMLRRLACRYDYAQNSAEALSFFYANHYDIVLLDCELPDGSGFAVATKMRLHEKQLQTKNPTIIHHSTIIAFSADDSEEYKNESKQAGMDDFFVKPLSAKQLKEIVS